MSSENKRLSPGDPSSFSRPDEVKVTHMDLEWDVDFQTKTIAGQVTLSVEKVNTEASSLILDTRDLTIRSVQDANSKQPLTFELGSATLSFGEKLEIQLPNHNRLQVIIQYATSPKCTALQWLTPEQTMGKKLPFLFSQCQAIHCRSLVPCQDSPSCKVTYNAKVLKITAAQELTVLMSALRDGEPVSVGGGKRMHSFRQPVSIPSYLLAIVAGDLKNRQIGPRSHVWAEPDMLDKAAYEFSDTEAQLSAAEELCGPYVWGVYDLLVLPPSFPYGGMENPCLTFVTPSMIAGDRSLVDLIAHEIVHSWMGNLVTNCNFEHFWLNEGFTVFVERKINGRLHGEKSRQFSAIGGKTYLTEEIETLGATNPVTCLVPDLSGIDPDDAYSIVPYEKGSAFLFYLEELVGGPNEFDSFLKSYIANFQYRSIVTSDFVDYIKHYFKNTPAAAKLEQVDWETWFHAPGLPPVFVQYDDSLAKACRDLSQRWSDWSEKNCPEPTPFSSDDLASFTSDQIQEFLARLILSAPLSLRAIKVMEELYKLDKVQNAEEKFRWLRLCLRAHYTDAVPSAIKFATSTGRMKYCRPLFKDLYHWDYTRPMAIEAYHQIKNQWMHVCTYTVGKDLKLIE